MAQIGELLIALQGDSKSWSSALKTAGQELRTLAAQAQETQKDLSKFNVQSINLLKGWKNEIGDTYKSLEQSLAPVKQGLVDQGKALDVNQKGINTLAIETVVASEKMKSFSESLKGTSSALWLMTMGLQQFGRAMTTAFTIPIAAAAGLAIKTFMDWEKGTLKIQTAAEITREAAEKITNSFMEISMQIPITVEDFHKAAYAAAQAGITGEEGITNFAKAAVMLSKVGGDAFKDLPIEKLANDLAMLAIGFGETGENMEEVNNIASMLLSVAKAVPGGLAGIVEGLRRVQGPAATLNISLSDTTALIGTLIASGVPFARAGTELGRVFLDMVKNIDKVGEALGYTTENFGEFKERMDTDVMGVLIELLQRYGQIESGVERATHLQEIFGTTALRAMLPLIENTDMLTDLQARANQELESGALLTAEFAIQAQSLSGTMTVFSNAVKALAKVVGDDLAPYFNYFVKTATMGLINLVKAWQEMNPNIKFAIFLIGGLLAIVGPLALALNTLFLQPISGLVTFITFLTKATGQLALQTGIASSAGVATNFFAFSLTNAATQVGLLIKGLAILAVKFAAILIVVGAVAAAIYALGKALGIRIKLPAMPKIALPKYKGVTAPKLAPGETVEELAEADEKAAKKREKELAKEL
ncbi:phage tail tape measure protein, partial [Patescibacteria group bacterium]|nr:phage tail tape measure protein [Patescibacteria group bacterium]